MACLYSGDGPDPLSELSVLTQCMVGDDMDEDNAFDYAAESGLDWEHTTFDQRYAATASLPHLTALQLEFDSFHQWLHDMLYVTDDDVRSDGGGGEQQYQWLSHHTFHGSLLDYLIRDKGECGVYSTFRVRPAATPASFLVIRDMYRMCQRGVGCNPVLLVIATRTQQQKRKMQHGANNEPAASTEEAAHGVATKEPAKEEVKAKRKRRKAG